MKGISIPPEEKRELLHVYLTQGYWAAKPLAIQYGLSPRIMAKYARKAGHKGKPGREPGKPTGSRVSNDPRWQRAIERGMVIA